MSRLAAIIRSVSAITSTRDARLLREHLDDVQAALKFELPPDKRRTLKEEERGLLDLIDLIESKDFDRWVASLRD